MKFTFSVILVLIFCVSDFGQDKLPPSHWYGLIIDQSKADEVLERFGKPESDANDNLIILKRNWVTKKLKDKSWRVMRYKTIKEFEEVKFLFDSDNTLEIIQLVPKIKTTANTFYNAYDIDTKPYLAGIDESFDPKEHKRNSGKGYPRRYPGVYEIAGINYEVFIIAGVINSSPGTIGERSKNVEEGERNYPGKVYIIQAISRTLENKNDVNILKYKEPRRN